jgi:anti-anti-sigma regulatory factor
VEIAKVAVRGVGVVVSLADAEFIDSSVLHTLFIGDRQMLAHGRRLVLYVGTDPRITTVLELANARERLYCCDSLEDAIDIASQRAPAYH